MKGDDIVIKMRSDCVKCDECTGCGRDEKYLAAYCDYCGELMQDGDKYCQEASGSIYHAECYAEMASHTFNAAEYFGDEDQ